jgi:hypothetical protein
MPCGRALSPPRGMPIELSHWRENVFSHLTSHHPNINGTMAKDAREIMILSA